MRAGALLIYSTIFLALGGYVIGALATVACGRFEERRWMRYAWAAGAVLLLIHIGCAFHFQHHWSHADAITETARQTRELTGIDWGGGIYFNYLFAGVWLFDAIWWLVAQKSHRNRPYAVTIAIHAFMLFIVFNATVVFGGWQARMVGIAICVILICGCLMRSPRRPRDV